MTKLGSLLGRKPILVVDKTAATTPPAAFPSAANDTPASDEARPSTAPVVERNVLELDQELFFPIVSQLGEENEAVRNLLIDAEHKIGELETIKKSIGRLVDPVSKTLRAFEEAKSEKLTLQGALNNTRVAHAKLREDLNASEKRASALDAECTRLREVLAIAQQSVNALETTKNEQSAELATRRSQISDLQRQLQHQATELQVARDENQRAAERVAMVERRIIALEAQANAAQQKFQMSDKERAAVQAMLDKSLNDAAQLSRRVLDADKALGAAKARMHDLEADLNDAQADRNRLATALEETGERLRSETIAHNARMEALQARASISEKLLDESRHTLSARAEELGAFDRRIAEATQMRDAIESKFAQVERALAERDAQIKELERSRAAMAERTETLQQAVDSRGDAYGRAIEKIDAQENLIRLLEGQMRAARETNDLQLEEAQAQLQRERLERTMAEGALEASRKDIARLLRELASLQGGASNGQISQEAVNAALLRFRAAA